MALLVTCPACRASSAEFDVRCRACGALLPAASRASERPPRPAAEGLLVPGDVLVDRFVVERRAGSGGMGIVYRAADRHTGEPVALKLMFESDPVAAARFAREATILAEIRHPRVVRHVAHGVGPSGRPYLAMEWIEGESLAERLARGRPGVAASVALIRAVAEGLGGAHRRGIVHRDLKPSNLLLAGNDLAAVKIVDFGIARHVAGGSSITRTGAVLGTPQYMSPEQARGDGEIDARTDVFALGCLLYHALAGRPPFTSHFTPAVLLQIVLDEPPRLSELAADVPEELEEVVTRMLAKDPAQRYRDAEAVAEALGALAPMSAARGGPRSAASPALTIGERRIRAFVLARPASAEPERGASGTLLLEGERERRLGKVVARWHGELTRFVDGGVAVSLRAPGAGTDQALRAARCALAMRRALPGMNVAIVFGQTDAATASLEQAIEASVRMLEGDSPGIRLDPRLAPLLAPKFEVSADARGPILLGAASSSQAQRTLLGRPAPFVGRQSELRVLEALAAEAFAEPKAVVVLVTAEAGMGKSRLRDELLARLAERDDDAAVWFAQGDPMSVGAPLAMLGQIVRQEAGIGDGEAPDVAEAKLGARVARHVPATEVGRVTGFLAALAQIVVASEPDVELRAARRDPMLMGDQMRRAWEDFVRAETEHRPLVVVLEDLHWSDPATIGFVHALLRNAAERPLFVLALARPDVRELFPKLWAGRALHELPLAALGKRAAETLVAGALAEARPETVAAIVERACGNPLYLEELVRAASTGAGAELPPTVIATLSARLEALDPAARRVLRAASVFGDTFWRSGLLSLLGGESGRSGAQRAAEVASWLEGLEESEIIVRRGPARFPDEVAWSFRHGLVRDVAYAMLTDDDKRLGHRLAGLWLEEAGERDARVLAEHFERGGEPLRAAGALRRAAEMALEGNDLGAALELSERAIACGAAGEALGALKLLQVEAHRWRGDNAAALRAAEEASAALPVGSPAWFRNLGELSIAAWKSGSHARLAPLADTLLDAPLSPFSLGAFVVAAIRVIIQLWFGGDEATPAALAARVREVAPSVGNDPVARAFIHRMAAYRALQDGDLGRYAVASNESRAAFAEAGDLRVQAIAACEAGFALVLIGRHAEAKPSFEEALAGGERVGLDEPVAMALHNLSYVLTLEGDLDRALDCAERATACYERLADPWMRAVAGIYLARVKAARGDLVGAAGELEPQATNPAVSTNVRARTFALLAEVQLQSGLVERAAESATSAMDLLATGQGIQHFEAAIRLAHVRTLCARGDVEGARVAVSVARERLLERAAKIDEPTARQSFLAGVPDNAATLALARQLTRG